jgi:hypothetical protein
MTPHEDELVHKDFAMEEVLMRKTMWAGLLAGLLTASLLAACAGPAPSRGDASAPADTPAAVQPAGAPVVTVYKSPT